MTTGPATRVMASGGMTVRVMGVVTLAVATGVMSALATPVVDTAVTTGVATLAVDSGVMSVAGTRVAGTRVGAGLLVTRGDVVGTIGADRQVAMSGVAGPDGRTGRRRPGLGGMIPRFRKGSRGPSSIVA